MNRPSLPDIVIGGAPRSGTTFLCEVLSKHPQVHVAAPFTPEPKVCMTAHPDGDPGIVGRYRRLFAGAPTDAVRIEKTSYYLENEEARERLVRLLPHARFVFILREPVARAYSNWKWSTRNGIETLPFAEAVRLEGTRPSPLPAERSYARPFDYMGRGRYGTLAEAWIDAVGRDRVGLWLFEDLVESPQRVLPEILEFIGVADLPWPVLRSDITNATETTARIDVQLASELRAKIEPEVRRLARVTGVDVSIWGYR